MPAFALSSKPKAKETDNLWGSSRRAPAPRGAAPVQLKASPGAQLDAAGAEGLFAHWAEEGTEAAGQPLPHLDAIQAAFGPEHDVSAIQATVGGGAAEAAEQMSAEAYAVGDRVGFARSPDLHTAAHEAAHVMQQRAGVSLLSDDDESEHERHADAVADRVVAGQAAGDLLPAPAAGGPAGVQRKKKNQLDPEALEHGGGDIELTGAAAKTAAGVNNQRWSGKLRAQLLAFLRGTDDETGSAFGARDVARIAQIQQGAGARADGILSDSTMAVLLHAGFEFSDDAFVDKKHPAGKLKPSEIQIEFWPGELEDMKTWKQNIHAAKESAKQIGDPSPYAYLAPPRGEGRLYVKVGGKIVATYRARGGPPEKLADQVKHDAVPTQGSFTLGKTQKGFTTSSWASSQIPWGATVRQTARGYEWQYDGGAWHKAQSSTVDPVFGSLPEAGDNARTWNMNDFGAMATGLQGSPGFYLHTTPATENAVELGEEVKLEASHGCVHLDPTERDEMIAHGYMQPGVRFTCKSYEDHLLPSQAREELYADLPR